MDETAPLSRSEDALLVELITRTYETVWTEYSAWSLRDSAATLKSLAVANIRPGSQTDADKDPNLYEAHISEGDDSEPFLVADFDGEGDLAEVSTVAAISFCADPFRPHPPYESCTPISRNLMVGDDPNELPFIAFSDDPSYNYHVDIEEYKYFRWQSPTLKQDQDSEFVAHETVKRLIEHHKLLTADIDKTAILPLPSLSLINLSRKRDFPKWKETQHTLPVQPQFSFNKHQPHFILEHSLTNFCNNLNCITGFCTTHLESQVPSQVPPKVPYIKIGEGVSHPCGTECFLQPPRNSTSLCHTTIWTTQDVDFLFSFLNYTPDISPCDLAIICRKPCREAHSQRAHYRSPVKQPEKGKSSAIAAAPRIYEESAKVFTPQLPCKHAGPCDAHSSCSCFTNKAHCHTRCGCSKACPRKWKGCNCGKSAKACATKKCSCFRANFECDPEVCISCEAKDHESYLCRNVGIQKARFKKTQVMESRWGLGLTILESCEKGDLITEYVGELIYEPTLRSRDTIATHRKRSYVFVLNPTFSVDSTYAGNETRYMNHSSNPNCNTTVYLVNGEHRIGVYAARRILEGEELLIDYGPMFFDESTVSEGECSQEPPPVLPNYDHSSDLTYSGEEELDSA